MSDESEVQKVVRFGTVDGDANTRSGGRSMVLASDVVEHWLAINGVG